MTANMTAKLFRRMLKEKVIPDAIRKTGSWAKEIVIQMDNAGGHGSGRGNIENTTLAKLRKFVEKHMCELKALCPERKDLPDIKFIAQPPNSPDLNVLDLGAWCSLQVAVEELKGSKRTRELRESEIREVCLRAWDEWDGMDKLGKLFEMLEKILTIVKTIGGDNAYEIPH